MILQEKGIPERRTEFLETCFDTFCKSGLENTSLQKLAESCGVTNGALLYYFGSKDNLVIEATAHCMAKVEDDFMSQAPTSFADIERFLREMPYLTAKLHGAKYRFMYQVYASPKYRECGKEFFKEDEDYLQLQLNAIRTSLRAFIATKTGSEDWKAGGTHE